MTTRIVCPSGLTGTLRGFTVAEEGILSKPGPKQLDDLLAACWLETTDFGPYGFEESVNWSRVLPGDRLYALLQLRIATYGNDYSFTVQCRNGACRKHIEWELSLDDLPVQRFAPEHRGVFSAGGTFDTVLPRCGKRVSFKLLTGEVGQKLPQARASSDAPAIAEMLPLLIQQVEGCDPTEMEKFFASLSFGDVDHLLDEIDRVGCGVDTTIDITCPHCHFPQEVPLPFGERFMLPGRGRTARRRQRVRSSRQST